MTNKDSKNKKKWDFSIGIKPMQKEEAEAVMEDFFEKIEDEFKNTPQSEIEKGAKKIKDYIDGKIGWAELFNFTPQMLLQMEEFGYAQFKIGRYPDAERVFKVLTVLDWNNHYYHSMMGTILQRQKRYGEAIAEYTQAIELYSKDVVSLTNRGEIFLQHNLLTEAEEDLKKAVDTDIDGKNKWVNRAKMLLTQLEKNKKGAKKQKGDK